MAKTSAQTARAKRAAHVSIKAGDNVEFSQAADPQPFHLQRLGNQNLSAFVFRQFHALTSTPLFDHGFAFAPPALGLVNRSLRSLVLLSEDLRPAVPVAGVDGLRVLPFWLVPPLPGDRRHCFEHQYLRLLCHLRPVIPLRRVCWHLLSVRHAAGAVRYRPNSDPVIKVT